VHARRSDGETAPAGAQRIRPSARHTGTVEEEGFTYAGRNYRSLSAIALENHWRSLVRHYRGNLNRNLKKPSLHFERVNEVSFKLTTVRSPTYPASPATGMRNTWVATPATKIAADFQKSLKMYPPIVPGTPDPYTPPGQ
jgi:hypothetical protein